MRTLAITQNVTLDGAIEMLGDWFDPQAQGEDGYADVREESLRQDADADAVLLGRRTFVDFRGFWPHQDEDRSGVTAYLDSVAKYVVSATLTDPGWQNSTILPDEPLERIARLKEQPGRHIVVTGSITLCHALIEAGLVDEFRLFTYPVVQGGGRRLFPAGYSLPRLRLLDAKGCGSGITYSAYAPVR